MLFLRLRIPLLILALLTLCCACHATGIAQAKSGFEDGFVVSIREASVTAVFPGAVYVEEPDRCSAIRIDTPLTNLQEGDVVDVEGDVETDSLTDERHVDAYSGCPTAVRNQTAPAPIAMPGKALVGGTAGFQKGVAGVSGINTIGLLVRTWGRVASFDDPMGAQSWFKITTPDGVEVKVIVPAGVKIDMDWGQVTVTGICTVEKVSNVMARVIRVRKQEDIVSHQSWAEDRLKSLTLDQKIGQLFQVRVQGGYTMNAADYENIQSRHVGGLVYFAYNFSSDPAQPGNLSNAFQSAAIADSGIPLLVSMDQEGGRVTRIAGGCDFPGSMGIGASRSSTLAFQTGATLGAEIRAVGGNMDLAPDLDVNNNAANPVIGVRSFGEDPTLVSTMGIAYMNGLHSTGVIATGKHFPGHGDTDTDSHTGLPIIPLSKYPDKDSFISLHCKSFRDCINSGIDCIMTAHIIVQCLDPSLPATLSPTVLTTYLRNTFGFDGVCMTDSMGMAGITSLYGPGPAAVMAIQAGNDLLSCLDPSIYEPAIPAVKAAVLAGTISEARLDQSVARVLRLKRRHGLFANPYVDASAASGIVGSAEHKATELSAARAAINVVKNTGNILPLNLTSTQKVLLVVVQSSSETTTDASTRFSSIVAAKHSNLQTIAITENPNSTSRNSVKTAAANAYVTIVATARANYVSGSTTNVGQVTLVNDLVTAGRRVIVVGTREPYELASFPNVNAYVAAYNYRNCGFQAAADVIFASWHPTGVLPVTIPDGSGGTLFGYGWGLNF